MKNVLMLVHDDSGQEARLQAALDLTRFLGGHLRCLDVVPLPLVTDSALAASSTVLYDEAPHEEENRERLNQRLAGEDVAWELGAIRGHFAVALLEAAKTADIVVLNKQLDRFPDPNMPLIAGQILVKGDVLILAVGDDCRGLDLANPALVAWDGSTTAMRTLQRAVPLLQSASAVTIFQVGPISEGTIPAEEAASYLSRHGVKSEIEVAASGDDVAGQILDAARDHEAGAVVMGGFGHSRLREAVFGGVTRELLRYEGVPLIIGH